jgi:hypothetical protein
MTQTEEPPIVIDMLEVIKLIVIDVASYEFNHRFKNIGNISAFTLDNLFFIISDTKPIMPGNKRQYSIMIHTSPNISVEEKEMLIYDDDMINDNSCVERIKEFVRSCIANFKRSYIYDFMRKICSHFSVRTYSSSWLVLTPKDREYYRKQPDIEVNIDIHFNNVTVTINSILFESKSKFDLHNGSNDIIQHIYNTLVDIESSPVTALLSHCDSVLENYHDDYDGEDIDGCISRAVRRHFIDVKKQETHFNNPCCIIGGNVVCIAMTVPNDIMISKSSTMLDKIAKYANDLASTYYEKNVECPNQLKLF